MDDASTVPAGLFVIIKVRSFCEMPAVRLRGSAGRVNQTPCVSHRHTHTRRTHSNTLTHAAGIATATRDTYSVTPSHDSQPRRGVSTTSLYRLAWLPWMSVWPQDHEPGSEG